MIAIAPPMTVGRSSKWHITLTRVRPRAAACRHHRVLVMTSRPRDPRRTPPTREQGRDSATGRPGRQPQVLCTEPHSTDGILDQNGGEDSDIRASSHLVYSSRRGQAETERGSARQPSDGPSVTHNPAGAPVPAGFRAPDS